MDPVQDEVLSIFDDSNGEEFSGFESECEEAAPTVNKGKAPLRAKKISSVVTVVSKKPEKQKRSATTKSVLSKNNKENVVTSKVNKPSTSKTLFDIDKLSTTDIVKLREALGMESTPSHNMQQYQEYADDEESYGHSLAHAPNLKVQFDTADLSDTDEVHTSNTPLNMGDALFEEGEIDDDEDWGLPRLKVPEKGKPVVASLANMLNVACTSQCDIESFAGNYKIPDNCDKVGAPLVNPEVWRIMDKRAQTLDRGIADIQNVVGAGMVPIMRLAEVLKPHIVGNAEAKALLSNSLTMMGQIQYNLSVRRRYMIHPVLKKKYQSLCNIAVPISSKLFGDDIAKDIKTCDSMSYLGREQQQGSTYRPLAYRGRGARFPRRGANYGNAGSFGGPSQYPSQYNQYRYQPYPQRGQYRGNLRGRIPRRSATVTAAPNDHN